MCWPHYRRQYSCYLNLLLLALRTWFIAEHLRSAVDLNGTGASDLNSARAIPTISEGKCENTWEFLGGIQNVINGKWMKFPHLNKLAYLVCFGTTCLDCYAVWPAVSQRLGGVAILTNPFSGSAHLSLSKSRLEVEGQNSIHWYSLIVAVARPIWPPKNDFSLAFH